MCPRYLVLHLLQPQVLALSGKRITVTGIGIFRFSEEGKVIGSWDNFDQLGVMQQLGGHPHAGTIGGSKPYLADANGNTGTNF